MGLNHNYLLYFKRERLWDALQGLVHMCDPIDPPPTKIHFPDQDLILPIATDYFNADELAYDEPEMKFALSMIFKEDDAIREYLEDIANDWVRRAPPDFDGAAQVAIGLIYLTVYTDLSKHGAFQKPTDMVLFRFGTTGTRMSFLFSESESIRQSFSKLLKNHGGVIGIFDWENDYGELFWFKGKPMQFSLSSNYLLPDEIEAELERGW